MERANTANSYLVCVTYRSAWSPPAAAVGRRSGRRPPGSSRYSRGPAQYLNQRQPLFMYTNTNYKVRVISSHVKSPPKKYTCACTKFSCNLCWSGACRSRRRARRPPGRPPAPPSAGSPASSTSSAPASDPAPSATPCLQHVSQAVVMLTSRAQLLLLLN